MKQYATVTVIGRDKTGVIARVTNFLFEQHANIEALEEQVTRGQFSMTLQASWAGKKFDAAHIDSGLEKLAAELGMEIKVRFTEPGRRQRFAIFVTREPRPRRHRQKIPAPVCPHTLGKPRQGRGARPGAFGRAPD